MVSSQGNGELENNLRRYYEKIFKNRFGYLVDDVIMFFDNLYLVNLLDGKIFFIEERYI